MSYGQPQPAYGQQPYYPPPRPERPLGITILAILGFLGGILIILAGILFTIGGAFFFRATRAPLIPLAGLFGAVGVVLIIIGIIELIISWGLWTGKGWAWWLTLIFSGLGVLGSLFSIATGAISSGAISLIIDAVIIYYLLRPHVKQYFGIG